MDFDAIIAWFNSSPFANVLGIILIVLAVIVVLKLVKNITKPIFIVLLIVAAVLIFFNVLDLAFLSASGEKLLNCICSEAISNSDIVSTADSILSGIR